MLLSLVLLAACESPLGSPTPTASPSPSPPPSPSQEASAEREIEVDGSRRNYTIHEPAARADDTAMPLVIALHGIGEDGEEMRRISGLNDLADDESFLVAYPDGLMGSWLDILPSGQSPGAEGRDTRFIDRMLTEIERNYEIAEDRIYVTGFSNGALFAFELACTMPERIAAIGLVAGAATEATLEECAPDQPVSYVAVHSTDDPVVPFEGGSLLPGSDGFGRHVPAREAAAFWAGQNGCADEPVSPTVQLDVTRTTYSDCEGGTAVELYALDETGHIWPRDQLETTTVIWGFFSEHPLSP